MVHDMWSYDQLLGWIPWEWPDDEEEKMRYRGYEIAEKPDGRFEAWMGMQSGAWIEGRTTEAVKVEIDEWWEEFAGDIAEHLKES